MSSKIYQISNQQYALKLPNKLKGKYTLLDAIKMHDSYVGLIQSNLNLYQINQFGQTQLTHSIDANSSNLLALSSTSICYYSANKNRVIVLDLVTLQVEEREINIQPKFARNQFQLFFFSRLQLFALIEKINEQNLLNIWYFKQQNKSFTFILNFTTNESQWKNGQQIYKINQFGLIGWPSLNDGLLDISLVCFNQGFKALNLQLQISQSTQIGAINNDGSDKLHIGLFSQKDSGLPVFVVDTSNNYGSIKNQRKIQNEGERNFGQIKAIYTLGDFLAFRSVIEGNQKVFIYSLETESIVDQYILKQKESSLIQSLTSKRSLIQTSRQTSKQPLSFTVHAIKRQNNLQIMNFLQLNSKLTKIAETKDKAVLVFGTSRSGKSTYIGYLCQKQLQHIYHEDLAYYQLRLKRKEEQNEKQLFSNKSVQVQENKFGALVQVPNWNDSQEIFAQIQLLIQQIFHKFKSIHVIVTIPYQEIQQPETYQKTIESMIHLISTVKVDVKDKQITEYVSILLTKIQDSQAHEIFKDQIELIKEQNEVVGSLLERVNEKQKVILFENKSYDTQEGEEASNNLFNSDMLNAHQKKSQESKYNLFENEETKKFKQALKLQINLYSNLTNKVMLYLSHFTVDTPALFDQKQFQEQNYHLMHPFTKSNSQNQDKNQLIYHFFMAISELKIILQKKSNSMQQRLPNLQKYLQNLRKQYQKITNLQDCELFRITFSCFVSSIDLLIKYFPEQTSKIIEKGICLLRNESNGILGKHFKQVIQKLSQNQLVANQKSILKDLSQYLGQPSGKPIVRIVKKQLSYEQEKQYYLKDKKKILETICSLPSNAMKLDLILQQIAEYQKKQKADNKDITKLRYYLRESSRICQFHQLYLEAIVLLMVIPDFIGIQVLLDQMVQICKRKNPIQSKKLFNGGEQDIIDELIVICRQCLRDSLASKLIYIRSYNKQANLKQNQLKKQQNISRNNQLSKDDYVEIYQQKLNKGEVIFYDLENTTFKQMIDKRIDVIKKCISYEEQSAQKYANLQALNWVIEKTPVPSLV